MEKLGYTDAWKAIVRPPRDEYLDTDLGPIQFVIGKNHFERVDFDLLNERKQKLKCSFFQPIDSERPAKELPCVIYLHGNSSSRVEGVPYVRYFLPSFITFFCFDCSGSGRSDGEFISLGWWEREDLKIVVDYLRKSGKTSTIGLWGRSMGAVTALLHADRDPSIAGLVLDSPFSSLTKLAEELCKKHAKGMPGFVYSMAQWYVKKKIKSNAHFSIDDLKPIDHVKNAFIPALFIVAKEDDFIDPKHGQELHDAYSGDKNLIWVEGDHNSSRPPHTITSIYIFFFNTLQMKTLLPDVVAQAEENIAEKYDPYHHMEHDMIIPKGPMNDFHQNDMTEEEMIEMAMKLSLESAEEGKKKEEPGKKPEEKKYEKKNPEEKKSGAKKPEQKKSEKEMNEIKDQPQSEEKPNPPPNSQTVKNIIGKPPSKPEKK